MTTLVDPKINVKVRLAGLWTAILIFYLYNDYFSIFVPGALEQAMAGRTPLGPMSQTVLLAMAASIVPPTLMVPASLILKARVARWANLVVGGLYTLIIAVLLLSPGSWAFYRMLEVIEIALTLTVVRTAWTWPREETP